ncbi:hypothetical protein PPROV_000915500 [Pycnococcus provasolii]|uniref:Plastid lipid-associated protein/fibrillin conserved domain-containing protein n=1 Tax=Pycnococcus provasolii TaxID=41880 RepID=A0A830HTC8_9CHLO|nr:hypothetical protein PPROV_000915500 [Pycnococcus provasolii]
MLRACSVCVGRGGEVHHHRRRSATPTASVSVNSSSSSSSPSSVNSSDIRQLLSLCRAETQKRAGGGATRRSQILCVVEKLEASQSGSLNWPLITGEWVLLYTDDGDGGARQVPAERLAFNVRDALTAASDTAYETIRKVAPELAGGIGTTTAARQQLPCQIIDGERGTVVNRGLLPLAADTEVEVEVAGSLERVNETDVSVRFERFSVKPSIPGAPALELPLGPVPFVEWYPNAVLSTTYLDDTIRINRGRTSLFVTARRRKPRYAV